MIVKEDFAQRAKGYIEAGSFVIDTETTGAPWINPDSEVCEIAIINASGTTIFESLVKPLHPIDDATSKIHGITNEMVANAPTWAELQPIVTAIIGDRPVLAYNANFDRPVMEVTARLAGLTLPTWQWGCLMEAYQRFARFSKWQKLELACSQIGYKPEGGASSDG